MTHIREEEEATTSIADKVSFWSHVCLCLFLCQ